MSLTSVGFSVMQWTDVHDLASRFVRSRMVASDGRNEFVVTSAFGFSSRGSVSVALVPVRGGRTIRYRFGAPATINGTTHPAGQLIERLTTSVVVNPTTGYFYRVHWLGVEGALIGSVLSSPWDPATGSYVSNEAGGYRSGDLLALVSEDDLATCANLHLFIEERGLAEIPMPKEVAGVV